MNSKLPSAILSGVSFIGIISSLLLPETLNAKLPETLEDAKHFGRGYSSVPKQLKPRSEIPITVE